MDTIDKMMEYEMGNLEENEILEMFQELVDDGVVWKLQGHYGRMANRLIEGGYING